MACQLIVTCDHVSCPVIRVYANVMLQSIENGSCYVFQMIDMTPNELQWLSGHMGHDVNTHKRNYRLHDNRIEVTKVGHLLTALDSGNSVCRTKNSVLEGKLEYFV